MFAYPSLGLATTLDAVPELRAKCWMVCMLPRGQMSFVNAIVLLVCKLLRSEATHAFNWVYTWVQLSSGVSSQASQSQATMKRTNWKIRWLSTHFNSRCLLVLFFAEHARVPPEEHGGLDSLSQEKAVSSMSRWPDLLVQERRWRGTALCFF